MAEQSQVSEGYACQCGFKTDDLTALRKHLFSGGRGVKKGTHKSLGRVNLQTGEITMPPKAERTPEQKLATIKAIKKQADIKETPTPEDIPSPEDNPPPKKDNPPEKPPDKPSGKPIEKIDKTTTVLSEAQEIKFVSKVFTCDYSPIMRAAVDASRRLFGWPSMPFDDFVDTIFWKYFKRCGVTLAGFIIDETEEERQKREAALAATKLERK